MPWLILGVFIVCLRADFCVNDSLFRVKNINGDNEYLAPDSARELREGRKGVVCLIGNFGNQYSCLKSPFPKGPSPTSQTPTDPAQENSLGMLRFYLFKQCF